MRGRWPFAAIVELVGIHNAVAAYWPVRAPILVVLAGWAVAALLRVKAGRSAGQA